jgi:hypothetical protein
MRRLLIFSSAILVQAASVGVWTTPLSAVRAGQVTEPSWTEPLDARSPAVVTLTGRIPALRAVVDAQGRLRFAVPAGIVTLNAAKGGFFGGAGATQRHRRRPSARADRWRRPHERHVATLEVRRDRGTVTGDGGVR